MISEIERRHWIRNRRRNRSFAVVWGLLASCTTIGGCVLLVEALRNGQILGSLVILGALGLPAAFGWLYAFGSAQAGLLIDGASVVIRNPLRTRRIALSDTVRFTAGLQPAQRGNPTPGILLEVKDGRTYPVWTLAREGLVWNSGRNVDYWASTAESLTELLQPG